MTTTPRRWIDALLHRGPGYDLPNSETVDLRTALTTLADRYDEIADRAPQHPKYLYIDPLTPAQRTEHDRAAGYRRAAADIRDVLCTGHVPHTLMTDAELEKYGTPEATS